MIPVCDVCGKEVGIALVGSIVTISPLSDDRRISEGDREIWPNVKGCLMDMCFIHKGFLGVAAIAGA